MLPRDKPRPCYQSGAGALGARRAANVSSHPPVRDQKAGDARILVTDLQHTGFFLVGTYNVRRLAVLNPIMLDRVTVPVARAGVVA